MILDNPEVYIQGGAVGIAILLIILLGFVLKWTYKLVTNHLNHSLKIMGRLVSVIDNNTKVLDRVDRKI